MKVEKVINNNLVRSFNKQNQEVLVMGCGLGFKKKVGDDIDQTKIEKIYTMDSKEKSNQLELLLEKMPLEYIQTANEIVEYAKISLSKKLNDNVYLTLTDHISFAIERYKQNISLKNALLWEIRRFYNHEFLIGKEALNLIENHLGVKLPEDEAGFIALHLVNATLDTGGMDRTKEMMRIIQDITGIVRYQFDTQIKETSLNYERFITHLKFFVQRAFIGSQDPEEGENASFFEMITKQYPKEYHCVLKVAEYMQRQYQITLTTDEMIYLTIHIHRITTK